MHFKLANKATAAVVLHASRLSALSPVGFIFLTDKGSSRSWNVFMWVMLFSGNGVLMCLYSMEWYARRSCPAITVSEVCAKLAVNCLHQSGKSV